MARQPRLDAPGVLHHVMAHGIERQPIFTDDRDRDEFVRRLSDLASEGKLIVYAWSLMPNHFHLLVRAGKISLSRSMRSLLTGYAGYFNRRYRRHGHVFQNRFKSIICEEEPYFLELVRYLHLNPLRAGVVKDLNELDRYPYTGHSVLVGRIDRSWQDTEDVWSRFGETYRKAAKSYRAFVSDGVGQGRRPDLMGGGLYRSMGGRRAVADLRRNREAYRSDERVLGSSAFVETLFEEVDAQSKGRYRKVELPKLKRRIAKDMGVSSHALSGGGRSESVSRARAALCYVWMHYLGQSGRVLAEELGVSPQAVYAASSRVERDGGLNAKVLERWCR
ncbi:MAG: transposase [Deltaproteobacteria bacterium]|nr:transposase [Deltaproteobacteria bacterium]